MEDWHGKYEYRDGQLYHRNQVRGRGRKGARVGAVSPRGYLVTSAFGRQRFVHRIVYEMHFGIIPPGMQIDHVDGDKLNNRIENLRLATASQNCANKRIGRPSKTGFTGVYWNRIVGRYTAQVTVNGETRSLGMYATAEEASAAYTAAAQSAFGEFFETRADLVDL